MEHSEGQGTMGVEKKKKGTVVFDRGSICSRINGPPYSACVGPILKMRRGKEIPRTVHTLGEWRAIRDYWSMPKGIDQIMGLGLTSVGGGRSRLRYGSNPASPTTRCCPYVFITPTHCRVPFQNTSMELLKRLKNLRDIHLAWRRTGGSTLLSAIADVQDVVSKTFS